MAIQSVRLLDGSAIRVSAASTGSLSGGNRYVTDENGNDQLVASGVLSNSRAVDAKFNGGDGFILVK